MPHMANLNWMLLYWLTWMMTMIYFFYLSNLSMIITTKANHKKNTLNLKNNWKW